MPAPTVVQIVNTLSVEDGGPALVAAELNLNLNRSQIAKSHLVSFRDHDVPQVTDLPEFKNGSVVNHSVIHFASVDKYRRRLYERLRSEVSTADIVFIHGYYLWWVPLLASICRSQKKPYLILPHGCLTERQQQLSQKKKKAFDLTVGRIVRNNMVAFVPATPPEQEDLELKFPRVRVKRARLGVALPECPVMAQGGLHDPIRLVSVSRIAPKKRIDLMIGSVQVLQDRGIACRLTVAGAGDSDLLEQLTRLADERGVCNSVDFVGQVVGREKDELYNMSDILLLPSEDENFGLAPIEALMRGCPVVVSSKVASTLPLEGNACAVLANPTEDSIADQVEHWAQAGDAEFQDRRSGGLRIATDAYSWGSVIEDWERILTSFVCTS